MAYIRREAELTYEGRLTIGDESHNLSDVSRVKFRRHGSSVDVKMLFSSGAKLCIRFYGECAYLVTNKGKGHEEETSGESRDVAFARLFGRFLANEQEDNIGIFTDSFADTSFDVMSFDESRHFGEEADPFFETPLRSRRESFFLPTVREFPVEDLPEIQEGTEDIEMMRQYVLGEISVSDAVVLSWLPGLVSKNHLIQ